MATVPGSQDEDTLVGGLGNDALFGNKGADTYIVTNNGGSDVIADISTIIQIF